MGKWSVSLCGSVRSEAVTRVRIRSPKTVGHRIIQRRARPRGLAAIAISPMEPSLRSIEGTVRQQRRGVAQTFNTQGMRIRGASAPCISVEAADKWAKDSSANVGFNQIAAMTAWFLHSISETTSSPWQPRMEWSPFPLRCYLDVPSPKSETAFSIRRCLVSVVFAPLMLSTWKRCLTDSRRTSWSAVQPKVLRPDRQEHLSFEVFSGPSVSPGWDRHP